MPEPMQELELCEVCETEDATIILVRAFVTDEERSDGNTTPSEMHVCEACSEAPLRSGNYEILVMCEQCKCDPAIHVLERISPVTKAERKRKEVMPPFMLVCDDCANDLIEREAADYALAPSTLFETVDDFLEQFVDIIASGYEWMCPKCETEYHEIEYKNKVFCKECGIQWETGDPNHAYG
jgi:protein-arginine kinase activator protein McsA